MIRAAFEKFWAWLKPKTIEVADEWWIDIADKPRPHFVSMVAGGFIFVTLWVALGC